MPNSGEKTLSRRLTDPKPEDLEIEMPAVVSNAEIILDAIAKKLETSIPPELRTRVLARFDQIRADTARNIATSESAVAERIILKNKYTNQALFERMVDDMMERHSRVFEAKHQIRGFSEAITLPKFEEQLTSADKNTDDEPTLSPASRDLPKIEEGLIKTLKEISLAQEGVDVMGLAGLEKTLEIALAVEQTIWRVEREGELDKRTGLMNDQAAATARFEIERKAYLEDGKKDEVMMWMEIDLDHFKKLNSKLGHPTVDQYILKPLADRLKGAIRANSTDLICRFGGDEFSILFNHVKRNSYYDLAVKIQEVIRKPFLTPKGEVNLTGSLGVLVIDKDAAKEVDTSSTDNFMADVRAKADVAALYSKTQGRDCLTVYSPDLQAFAESEQVYIDGFIRQNYDKIQELLDADKPAAADRLEQGLMALAKAAYAAKSEVITAQ